MISNLGTTWTLTWSQKKEFLGLVTIQFPRLLLFLNRTWSIRKHQGTSYQPISRKPKRRRSSQSLQLTKSITNPRSLSFSVASSSRLRDKGTSRSASWSESSQPHSIPIVLPLSSLISSTLEFIKWCRLSQWPRVVYPLPLTKLRSLSTPLKLWSQNVDSASMSLITS